MAVEYRWKMIVKGISKIDFAGLIMYCFIYTPISRKTGKLHDPFSATMDVLFWISLPTTFSNQLHCERCNRLILSCFNNSFIF